MRTLSGFHHCHIIEKLAIIVIECVLCNVAVISSELVM